MFKFKLAQLFSSQIIGLTALTLNFINLPLASFLMSLLLFIKSYSVSTYRRSVILTLVFPQGIPSLGTHGFRDPGLPIDFSYLSSSHFTCLFFSSLFLSF